MWRMDHRATADVQADVARRVGDVARDHGAQRHVRELAGLGLRVVREPDTGRAPCRHRESRAVEAARPGAGVAVRLAELLLGEAHRDAGGAAGRRDETRVEVRPAAAPATLRRLRCVGGRVVLRDEAGDLAVHLTEQPRVLHVRGVEARLGVLERRLLSGGGRLGVLGVLRGR